MTFDAIPTTEPITWEHEDVLTDPTKLSFLVQPVEDVDWDTIDTYEDGIAAIKAAQSTASVGLGFFYSAVSADLVGYAKNSNLYIATVFKDDSHAIYKFRADQTRSARASIRYDGDLEYANFTN